MAVPGGVRARVREHRGARGALGALERRAPRRLVVGDERARLVERRRLRAAGAAPVGGEAVRALANDRRLAVAREAVPVVGDGDRVAGEPHVLGAPVRVADHELAGGAPLARGGGDVVGGAARAFPGGGAQAVLGASVPNI